MRPVFCLALMLAGAQCHAATPQEEIDAQVWRPFLAASNAFDAEAFLAVNSPELVRVSRTDGRVEGFADYAAGIRAGFERARARTGLRRESELRFLERHASSDMAYEVGYFRSRATLLDGGIRTRYSRFLMVLRKEDGAWRILVDSDTTTGGEITEEMFQAAQPLTPAR